MPDNGMSGNLSFEELIKDFSKAEQFLAREVRSIKQECETRKSCYPVPAIVLSKRVIAGGVGGVGVISAIINIAIEVAKRLLESG